MDCRMCGSQLLRRAHRIAEECFTDSSCRFSASTSGGAKFATTLVYSVCGTFARVRRRGASLEALSILWTGVEAEYTKAA